MGKRLESDWLDDLVQRHPYVPSNILRDEARYKLGRQALHMLEAGMTQESIAKAFGCSQVNVSTTILRNARRDDEDGLGSPLERWQRDNPSLIPNVKQLAGRLSNTEGKTKEQRELLAELRDNLESFIPDLEALGL